LACGFILGYLVNLPDAFIAGAAIPIMGSGPAGGTITGIAAERFKEKNNIQ
jgi:hypothetical protein